VQIGSHISVVSEMKLFFDKRVYITDIWWSRE